MKKLMLDAGALVAAAAAKVSRLANKSPADPKPAKSKGPRKAGTYRGERRLHAKAFARAHGLPFHRTWERNAFRTLGRR